MKRHYISQQEIHQLFHAPARRRRLPSWQLLTASLLIIAGIFFLINAPAIALQFDYWWRDDIVASRQTNRQAEQTNHTEPAPAPSVGQPDTQSPTTKSKTSTVKAVSRTPVDPATIANNTLYIPKINVRVPIIWDVSAGSDLNSDLLKALERGIARYPQTALPNQTGNLFLTGHSSNYWWEKGNYKTVFALLNRLVAGDLVHLKYQDKLYTYRVNGQKVVKPTDTSVLAPTATPTLSLMTCTPTGTTLLRRIVTANLINPTEGLVSQPTSPTATGLDGVR